MKQVGKGGKQKSYLLSVLMQTTELVHLQGPYSSFYVRHCVGQFVRSRAVVVHTRLVLSARPPPSPIADVCTDKSSYADAFCIQCCNRFGGFSIRCRCSRWQSYIRRTTRPQLLQMSCW